jgi:hypothetical protein
MQRIAALMKNDAERDRNRRTANRTASSFPADVSSYRRLNDRRMQYRLWGITVAPSIDGM